MESSAMKPTVCQDKRQNEIELLVKNCMRQDKIKSQSFCFIMVHYFSKSEIGDIYTPAELGAAHFSLQHGMREVFHRLVNPAFNIFGSQYFTEEHAYKTHRLPIPPDALGEADLKLVYKDLWKFLRISGEATAKPTIIYTQEQCIPDVIGVLKYLNDGIESKLKVYPIENLFYILKREVCNSVKLTPPESILLTNSQFALDKFEHLPSIGCAVHKKQDLSRQCAKSFVTRWCFTFASYICPDLNIKLQSDRHYPPNAPLSTSIKDPKHAHKNQYEKVENIKPDSCSDIEELLKADVWDDLDDLQLLMEQEDLACTNKLDPPEQEPKELNEFNDEAPIFTRRSKAVPDSESIDNNASIINYSSENEDDHLSIALSSEEENQELYQDNTSTDNKKSCLEDWDMSDGSITPQISKDEKKDSNTHLALLDISELEEIVMNLRKRCDTLDKDETHSRNSSSPKNSSPFAGPDFAPKILRSRKRSTSRDRRSCFSPIRNDHFRRRSNSQENNTAWKNNDRNSERRRNISPSVLKRTQNNQRRSNSTERYLSNFSGRHRKSFSPIKRNGSREQSISSDHKNMYQRRNLSPKKNGILRQRSSSRSISPSRETRNGTTRKINNIGSSPVNRRSSRGRSTSSSRSNLQESHHFYRRSHTLQRRSPSKERYIHSRRRDFRDLNDSPIRNNNRESRSRHDFRKRSSSRERRRFSQERATSHDHWLRNKRQTDRNSSERKSPCPTRRSRSKSMGRHESWHVSPPTANCLKGYHNRPIGRERTTSSGSPSKSKLLEHSSNQSISPRPTRLIRDNMKIRLGRKRSTSRSKEIEPFIMSPERDLNLPNDAPCSPVGNRVLHSSEDASNKYSSPHKQRRFSPMANRVLKHQSSPNVNKEQPNEHFESASPSNLKAASPKGTSNEETEVKFVAGKDKKPESILPHKKKLIRQFESPTVHAPDDIQSTQRIPVRMTQYPPAFKSLSHYNAYYRPELPTLSPYDLRHRLGSTRPQYLNEARLNVGHENREDLYMPENNITYDRSGPPYSADPAHTPRWNWYDAGYYDAYYNNSWTCQE